MATLKNITDLLTEAATNVPDNTTQLCSPQDLRELSENIAFSSYNKITDASIVGLKEYDTAISYPSGQSVFYLGDIYQANTTTTPGAFNPVEWDKLTFTDTNFTTGNLTMTANRDHNLSGYLLEFSGGEMRFQGSDDLEATTNFSLQNNSGNTLAAFRNNGTFIQSLFTSATADGNLHNNSVNLYTDGTNLKARYKDNGGIASDLNIGASYDVCAIYDATGTPTMYSDIQSAITAASAGETVEILADITETGAVEITLKDGVNINGNGHTYTLSSATASISAVKDSTAVTCKILNWTVVRTTGTGYCLYITNGSSEIDATGSLFKSTSYGAVVCHGKLYNCNAVATQALYWSYYGRVSGATYGEFYNCKAINSQNGFWRPSVLVDCVAITSLRSLETNIASKRISNFYGYSTGEYAHYGGGSNCVIEGGYFHSAASYAFYCLGPTIINGGYYFSSANVSVVASGASTICEINGAKIISSGGAGLVSTQGAKTTVSNSRIESSANYAVGFDSGNTVLNSYNNTIICTYNNVLGYAIWTNNTGVTGVIKGNILEVANTGANCITGLATTTLHYADNIYKGSPTTPINANIAQGITGTEDNYGNILI